MAVILPKTPAPNPAPIGPDGYHYLNKFLQATKWNRFMTSLIAAAISCLAIFWVANPSQVDPIRLLSILGLIFLINIMAILIADRKVLKPMIDLIETINFMQKPHSSVEPIMPNQPKNVDSGFESILDYIYQKRASATPEPDVMQQKLIKSFDQSKIGLLMYGPDNTIIYSNAEAQKIIDKNQNLKLTYDQDTTIGDWIHDSQLSDISANRSWRKVSFLDATDEDRRFFDIEASFRKGEFVETIVVISDHTKLYTPEEEDFDFIAFAAHELRGPITIIRGYLDILEAELKPSVKDEYQQIFDRLVVSANRLSSYINNILSVSRYDRKHLQVFIHEETAHSIIDSVIDDVSLRAKTQNRLLAFEIEDELPTIAADRSSVGEVLTNLIDNSIKYSHEGGSILVRVYKRGENVDFEVIDHGIGMPSNVVSNLFKKFYRSHRSRESVAGTGIGLYLSKAIIDSHGGFMNVKSSVGEGSVFTFSLPIFAMVSDKLKATDGANQVLIRQQSDGWIRNHGLYKN